MDAQSMQQVTQKAVKNQALASLFDYVTLVFSPFMELAAPALRTAFRTLYPQFLEIRLIPSAAAFTR
ncbi:hypothetical protein FACS1894202_08370 [Clostridia bacterium]|nr:hypothetical protein FACS1894202_08370 [Clostridia bacterium]